MTPEKLTTIRARLGLTIADMCRALDIPRATYNHWERGERDMPAAAVTAVRLLAFVYDRGLAGAWRAHKNMI